MSNPKIPTNKNFGIVFALLFLFIAAFTFVKHGYPQVWSLTLASIFLFLGLINSHILTPLNKLWFKFGLLLGGIISPIVMALIFFLVVTPTGLLMRIFKKDLLNLRFNNKQTYWIEKTEPKSKMKNQF